ncbi:hypothetical protein D8674_026670 [Pyrus ussuriensis x Pyrus communis]|uniref:Uncharacterized protein n=1 Tax=Pyrus ussuriensis x Pyrus communis TaxID=2448454 RepID=A0A5N5I7J1_9ROSA|nr:hypothetical protein D8674_026670 [Pyrus ussuriensis x Pyrus communis]
MRWFSELSTRLIDCFKNLVNIFTNTYLRFHVKLAEVERLDNILTTMAYKQGLNVNSPFSQKLNEKKYNYATLAKCLSSLTVTTKPKGRFLIKTAVGSSNKKEKTGAIRLHLPVEMT